MTIGAVLFFGGVLVATSVMDAGATHNASGNVHACVNRYTNQARIMLPGRPPACSSGEVLVELGGGADVVDLQAQFDALEAQVVALDTQVVALEAQVPDCLSDEAGDAVFTGCDVEVRNGLDSTETANGKGNLIVGYNENSQTYNRDGSHNLVVGANHGYESYGGFVAGFQNIVSGIYATVSGGADNEATASVSSVSGGSNNTASGISSSVSGGQGNTASGDYSSVGGGANVSNSNAGEFHAEGMFFAP